ncbi:MAG: MFS transporter [Acidimicrobiales bacterium]
MLAPLKRRDFRALWTGMAVSLLGDGIFLVAVAWQAYAISDHPSALALIGVATSAPQVAFLLLGGAFSDRFSRRAVLFWADATRAVAVAVLSALVAGGHARLFELCLAGAVIGTATAFASPAFEALVPQLVPEAELTQANAVEQFVRPGAIQLAGPALGGVAVAVLHPWGSFALDGATFAFSAFCTLRISVLPTAAPSNHASLWAEVAEGLRYVRGQVWLWGTFVSATFTYLLFIGPTQVLLPYIVRNSLHKGASTYGAVLAVGGAGALIGAVASARRRHPGRPMVWIYGWWALATLAVAGYGLATNAWGLACAAAVINGAEVAGAVMWTTVKQRRVVNSMLGRVSSIDWCISTALLPLSYALTAPVAQALGARRALVAAGVLGAAVTLGFLLLPGMRTNERRVAVWSSGRT